MENYKDYLSVSSNSCVEYAEYIVEHLNSRIEYSEYLNNIPIEHVNSRIEYSEYLNNIPIEYTNYILEHLEQSIQYSQDIPKYDLLKDRRDKIISIRIRMNENKLR